MTTSTNSTKTVYVLIRIPKSGSTSLETMVRKSLPDNVSYHVPPFEPEPCSPRTLYEKLRRKRQRMKRMVRRYGAFNESAMWNILDQKTRDGDLISGHFTYANPKLPNCNVRFVTLLRNPIDRLISDYHYNREGYLKRSRIQQAYLTGNVKAAGTGTFLGYLEYMLSDKERHRNPATGYITGSRNHPDPFLFLQESYFHFGILEHMDLFSSQLAKKLRIEVSEVWTNKTKTRQEPDLTEVEYELMQRLLGKDIELYSKARLFISEN